MKQQTIRKLLPLTVVYSRADKLLENLFMKQQTIRKLQPLTAVYYRVN